MGFIILVHNIGVLNDILLPLPVSYTHLDVYKRQALRDAVKSIVGVQFRNCATVGGSIFGRFGFSDVLSVFLSLDTTCLLYTSRCV